MENKTKERMNQMELQEKNEEKKAAVLMSEDNSVAEASQFAENEEKNEGEFERETERKNELCRGLNSNAGVGVIEIILILVVLIALVLIFKNQLTGMVEKAMAALEKSMDGILS